MSTVTSPWRKLCFLMDPWWYHFVRTELLWLNCLLSFHLLRLFDWLFNFYMRSGGDRQSNQCHGDQTTSEVKLLAGTFFIVFYEWWFSLLGSNMFPSHSLNHSHTHFFFWYLCRKHFLKGPKAANTHSLDINTVVHFFCLFVCFAKPGLYQMQNDSPADTNRLIETQLEIWDLTRYLQI